MTYQNENALKALARRCSDEMTLAVKGVPKKQRVAILRPISDRYAAQAELIGYCKIRLHCEIALMNGMIGGEPE